MVPHADETVLFRDYPLFPWLVGALTVVVGLAFGTHAGERVLVPLVGAAIVAFGNVLTVAADGARRTLTLRYRSLFRATTHVIPYDEIAAIDVVEDREGERMYRVELVLRSGRVLPLRGWHSSLRGPKVRRAQRLRQLTGAGGDVRRASR